MPYKNVEKQRKAQRESYARLKDDISERRQSRRNQRREDLLTGQVCVDCGLDDTRTFEFHHRDPTQKDFTIADILSHNFDKLMREVEKCDILCANCHKIRHFEMNSAQ